MLSSQCPIFMVTTPMCPYDDTDEMDDVGMGYAEEGPHSISYAHSLIVVCAVVKCNQSINLCTCCTRMLRVRLRCLVSGLKFEAELSSHLVRVGRVKQEAGSGFAASEWWPLFRTRLVGVWEMEGDTSESEDYEPVSN